MTDGILKSEVKGIPIEISPTLMAQLLNMRTDGDRYEGGSQFHWNDFERQTALREMVRDENAIPTGRPGVSDLTLENRLLHYVLVRILIPRGSNYASVLEDDILGLWALLHEKHINWPNYITQTMVKAKRRSGASLPYAIFITKILTHFRVPIQNEAMEALTMYHRMDEGRLHKMGMVKYGDQWYRTDIPQPHQPQPQQPPQQEPEEPPSDTEPPQPDSSVPPPTAAPSMEMVVHPTADILQQILQSMNALRATTEEGFIYVHRRIERLETHVQSLDIRLTRHMTRDEPPSDGNQP